jgi:threonine/homoserine/homoserine lactone efflux protein
MSISNLLFFSAMEVVLCFTPGPAVLLVVSQSMQRGLRPSLRGALGILTGNAIYFALSAAGLGAILIASRTLFEVLRWFGAGYLVVIGARMILRPASASNAPPTRRALGTFAQGLLTQLANPKAIVFFTALLPQFIDPHGPVTLQFVILGILSTVIEFPVLATYAFAADRGRAAYSRHAPLIERLAGACLIAAGAKLAMTRA